MCHFWSMFLKPQNGSFSKMENIWKPKCDYLIFLRSTVSSPKFPRQQNEYLKNCAFIHPKTKWDIAIVRKIRVGLRVNLDGTPANSNMMWIFGDASSTNVMWTVIDSVHCSPCGLSSTHQQFHSDNFVNFKTINIIYFPKKYIKTYSTVSITASAWQSDWRCRWQSGCSCQWQDSTPNSFPQFLLQRNP